MREFLKAKGFTEETLNLLTEENVKVLADEYEFGYEPELVTV